jgi:hypothetical protein
MSVDAEWFINTTTLLRQSKRDGASGKCTVVYVGIVLEGGDGGWQEFYNTTEFFP